MKKFLLAFMTFVFFITLVSCRREKIESEETPPPAGSGKKVVATNTGVYLAGIKTAVVEKAPMAREIKLLGQISPLETGRADLTSPLSGIVSAESPFVKVGTRVQKGERLAVINSIYGQTGLQVLQKLEQDRSAFSQAQDNALAALAELRNSRVDFARKKALFNEGVSSKSDYEDARERYQKATSAVRDTATLLSIAKAALERDQSIYQQSRLSGSALLHRLTPLELKGGPYSPEAAAGAVSFYITAPISGTVTSLNISPGFAVSPGFVIGTIINTGKLYADARAYESDLPFIHEGDKETVVVPSFGGKTFSGKVRYVGSDIDPATRTALVRSLVENRGGVLRSGMFVSVILLPEKPRMALTVPENAVLIHADQRYLYVETQPNQYEKKSVTVGLTAGGKTEILSGVRQGERVVTDGNLLLEGQE